MKTERIVIATGQVDPASADRLTGGSTIGWRILSGTPMPLRNRRCDAHRYQKITEEHYDRDAAGRGAGARHLRPGPRTNHHPRQRQGHVRTDDGERALPAPVP